MNAPAAAPGPPPALGKWFRLVVPPAVAVLATVTAILLLRGNDDDSAAVRRRPGDLPAADSGDAAPETGRPAPDFILPATEGATYRLSGPRGHAVVLNVWATWCGPCRSEMPALDAVYREKGGDTVIVLAITVRESAGQARGYAGKLNLTMPALVDSSGAVAGRYRVSTLPTTYLIDRDGVVDAMRIGPYTLAKLFGRVEQPLDDQ